LHEKTEDALSLFWPEVRREGEGLLGENWDEKTSCVTEGREGAKGGRNPSLKTTQKVVKGEGSKKHVVDDLLTRRAPTWKLPLFRAPQGGNEGE